jgi:hypothetical protein
MLAAMRRASSRVIKCHPPVTPAVFHFLDRSRGTEV